MPPAIFPENEDVAKLDGFVFTPGAPALQAALDTALQVRSGGDAVWTAVTAEASDGIDAVQSGAILESHQTFLDTTVMGPGMLRFDWKVSSESGGDYLQFWVNGARAISSLTGEKDWTSVEYWLDAREHRIQWRYFTNASGIEGQDRGWIDQLSFAPPPSLRDAVDNTALSFATGGSGWSTVSSALDSSDGVDYAYSLPTGDGESAWMETTVSGPGTLGFWWSVSSSSSDYLRFSVDDVVYRSISNSAGWTYVTQTLSAGLHTVRWSYDKDASGSSNNDQGYVDQISWDPASPAPLANALDAPLVPLTTSGRRPLFQADVGGARWSGCSGCDLGQRLRNGGAQYRRTGTGNP